MLVARVLASILACFSNVASVQAGDVGLDKGVAVLNSTNFEDARASKNFPVLVAAFYQPKQEASDELIPSLEKAAGKTLKKMKVRVAKVDAVADAALATQYGVEVFPSIVAFKDGTKHSAKEATLWQKQEIKDYAQAVAGSESLFAALDAYNGLHFQWKLALRSTPLAGSLRSMLYTGFPVVLLMLVLLLPCCYCCCCTKSTPKPKTKASNSKKSSSSTDPAEDGSEPTEKAEDEKKGD